jgi:hypothetical protein
LGEVVIAWSNVTDCLEELFAHLSDIDNAFVLGVFVEKIRDGQLDEVVGSLAARTDDPTRDAIRTWIKRLKTARKQRNEYLHGVYKPFQHSDGEHHLYLLGRRALNRQNGTAEPNISKLLSANLSALHSELMEIQVLYERLQREHFPYRVRQDPDPLA